MTLTIEIDGYSPTDGYYASVEDKDGVTMFEAWFHSVHELKAALAASKGLSKHIAKLQSDAEFYFPEEAVRSKCTRDTRA